MTEFDRILDKHFIDFDKYTDRYCIGREEFELICKEYAIEMCRLQRENCAKSVECENDYIIVDESILDKPLPKELQ